MAMRGRQHGMDVRELRIGLDGLARELDLQAAPEGFWTGGPSVPAVRWLKPNEHPSVLLRGRIPGQGNMVGSGMDIAVKALQGTGVEQHGRPRLRTGGSLPEHTGWPHKPDCAVLAGAAPMSAFRCVSPILIFPERRVP